MKTIYITSKEGTDYIINPLQITHIREDTRIAGTFIFLSCGTKINVEKRIYDVQQLINEALL